MQATERFKLKVLPERRSYYSTNERPDVWFEPTEVWEIRGADLTLSAVHKSAFGLLHPARGVSLRWVFLTKPRLCGAADLRKLKSRSLVWGALHKRYVSDIVV